MKKREPDHTKHQDNDAELMEAFARGNEEAFVVLYRKHRDRVVNYARRLLGDQARAEEAAQDVFLKLYQVGSRYQARSRFSTFLYRIATNHCFNILARHDNKLTDRDATTDTHVGDNAPQAEAVAQSELRKAIQTSLNKLPEKQRAALVLCHYNGLSYQEVAETLRVSTSAVKSLVHRARDGMMRELSPWLEADQEVCHAL